QNCQGFMHASPDSLPGKERLFLGELAASVQAIKIENGVQHHGVGAARLPAIDRIYGKKNHVAFARRHIHDGWMLCDFVPTLDQTGNEQILFIGITEDHPRAVGWRNHAEAVASLFVGHRWCFPDLGGRLFGSLYCGAAHGEIRIIRGAAASGASMRFVAEAAASPRAGNTTEGKDRPVVTIGSNFLIVTVGDGAATVHQPRADDGAYNFHALRSVSADAGDEADLRGEAGSVRPSSARRHQPSVCVLSHVCINATRAARTGWVFTLGAAPSATTCKPRSLAARSRSARLTLRMTNEPRLNFFPSPSNGSSAASMPASFIL